MKRQFKLAIILSFLIPFSMVAVAANDTSHVGYRQMLMKATGAHMGSIGAILKNRLPFNTHIINHAEAIALNASLMNDAFKKRITQGRTDAKSDIWNDWEKFKKASARLEVESRKLARIAERGNMSEIFGQVKNVGKSCGGCHKPFRKPKAERFAR